MKIQKIDKNCTKCMLCVKDCVSAVWRDVDGIPEVVAPGDCNLCSHCLSVCSHDAVFHDGLDRKQVEKTDKDLISPEVYETIARGRRSIRQYKDNPIPDDVIENVIGLVNHTPTASNSQHVSYIVITDKRIIKKISAAIFGLSKNIYSFFQKFPGNIIYKALKLLPSAESITRYVDPMPYYIDETAKGRDFVLHSAPCLILVTAPKGEKFASENANMAATNIMNYAYAKGLGTCYIGFLNIFLKYSRKTRRLVKLPDNQMAYACIIMGYPAYKHANTASRKKPRVAWVEKRNLARWN